MNKSDYFALLLIALGLVFALFGGTVIIPDNPSLNIFISALALFIACNLIIIGVVVLMKVERYEPLTPATKLQGYLEYKKYEEVGEFSIEVIDVWLGDEKTQKVKVTYGSESFEFYTKDSKVTLFGNGIVGIEYGKYFQVFFRDIGAYKLYVQTEVAL